VGDEKRRRPIRAVVFRCVPGIPWIWSESLKRTEVAPNRIAKGKGARRGAGSEGSRRRTTALTDRNRIEGQRPQGEPATYGEARTLPGGGEGRSGGDRGKETGLTLGGLLVCPDEPDYPSRDGWGWAWRSQQRP
jgi:hypothetical protein